MIIMKVADDRTVAITGRITLFLFFYSIFLFMLYVQGSLQDFMESSLLGILVLYRYCALIYMVFAVFNIALQALSPPARGRRFLRIGLSFAGLTASAVLVAAVSFLLSLLEPTV